MNTTITVNPKSVSKNWYVIDAKEVILGRLASTVARLLMGKNKSSYSPSHDSGDYVIVLNAEKIALSGKKREDKRYFTHSTYPGGGRNLSYGQLSSTNPGLPLRHAVKGMLPHTSLGKRMILKLYIYGGTEHPHGAQQPEILKIK